MNYVYSALIFVHSLTIWHHSYALASAGCDIGGQIVRGIAVRLAVLAVLALAALSVTGLSAVPASSAVDHASRVNAASHQVLHTTAASQRVRPHTKRSFIKPLPRAKAAWQAAIARVRAPHHGCFSASYPALTWHAVKCGIKPNAPDAAAQPAGSASRTAPAAVGGGNDYVANFSSGTISQATGTFLDVSSGIKEQGLIDNKPGTEYEDAFSLQLNSNAVADPAVCSGASDPADCSGWQQFLYTYGTSGSAVPTSQIYMQYWVYGYGGSNCPSGYSYFASSDGSRAGCMMNSQPTDVPSLTASDLATVALSGMAATGGSDQVTMSTSSGSFMLSASDSVLGLGGKWDQTEWGVFGDTGSGEADFTSSDTLLEAQTSFAATSFPAAPTCGFDGTQLTNETNNLNLTTTTADAVQDFPTITSAQTTATSAASSCAPEPGSQAPGLAVDGLTGTWAGQSDLDSTGSPQPLPTTTSDCGNWSDADGTQVVGLNNGDDLWTFGDTYLGPAVARQDFFNNGSVHNSMVLQDGSSFTTITGGSGCGSSAPTTATAPITSPDGSTLWPASSIVYGSDVEKFYYTVNSGLVQQQPEVAEIPQADLESGDTYSAQAAELNGCTVNPIMWGAATISDDGYTYIYGSQQYSSTGGDTGGLGGDLYLARTADDPSNQGTWEYYTINGWSAEDVNCTGLVLAPLGGMEPIQVPTEFSVAVFQDSFWLVDDDPANGDLPRWAVAHEALTPTGFSSDPEAAVPLFQPGVTSFAGISDDYPGAVAYAVRMMEPSAVTATDDASDAVIAYNVNDSDDDNGCVPLTDYDANAYRPRFIDVPANDFSSPLYASDGAATTAAGGTAAGAGQGTEPPASVSFSPQRAAPGQVRLAAALSRAGSEAAATTSWTYDPDTVPDSDGVTWSGACPTSYPTITASDITFSQLPDGSVEVSWPDEGPDVWYWFYWQDVTSDPGTWNENEFWTEGPNADGYLPAQQAGATVSTGSGGLFDLGTIYQVFTLPPGANPGDKFSFWVQAFAAGNGNVTSRDSSADAASYTPTSPSETVSGLTATAGTDAVSLTWTAAPAIEGQSIWYSVRYKLTSSSTWTYTTDYIFAAADMTPLIGGQEYEFEVAVTDDATVLSSDANWSAAIDATPNT